MLAGIWIVPKAFARITVNTIDTLATLADNGRLIIVTGPVQNDQVEWNDQQVTVTQRSAGAVAGGHTHFRGTTSIQQWEVEVPVNVRGQPGSVGDSDDVCTNDDDKTSSNMNTAAPLAILAT